VTGRANKVPQALRLDAELAAWLDSYSLERGVKKIVLVEAALRSFREDCEAGVPELESAPGTDRVSRRRESSSGPGGRSSPPASFRAPGASASAGRVRRAGGDPSVSRRVVEPSPAGVVDDVVPAAVPASALSRAERFRRATQGS
jgi:hypothetical protein